MFSGHSSRWRSFVILLVAVSAFAPAEVLAAKRVALLIGNEKYEATSQLNNPANDVELMKASFEEAGFDSVTTVHDLGRQDTAHAGH